MRGSQILLGSNHMFLRRERETILWILYYLAVWDPASFICGMPKLFRVFRFQRGLVPTAVMRLRSSGSYIPRGLWPRQPGRQFMVV